LKISHTQVLEEPGRFRLRTCQVPAIEPDQMLLKVEMVSICGSDRLIYQGGRYKGSFPKILGHEVVGFLEEVGAEAKRFAGLSPGDRVVLEPYLSCGECEYCRAGHYHMCVLERTYGITLDFESPPYLLGGYGEYMVLIPGTKVHRVDPEVPPEAACLGSVVGNGVRWIFTRGRLRPGESVVILGPGSQGLSTALAAKEAGAGAVIVCGLACDGKRLSLAQEFGATHTINVEAEDTPNRVKEILGGKADLVVECAGTTEAVAQGLELVGAMGRYVLVGLDGGQLTRLLTDHIVSNEIDIRGGHGQAGDMERAMDIINSGRYPVEKIITHVFSLEETPRAMEFFVCEPEKCIRTALVP